MGLARCDDIVVPEGRKGDTGVVVVADMSKLRDLVANEVRRGVGCPGQTRLNSGGPGRDVDELGPGCPSTWTPPTMVSRSSHEENFFFENLPMRSILGADRAVGAVRPFAVWK